MRVHSLVALSPEQLGLCIFLSGPGFGREKLAVPPSHHRQVRVQNVEATIRPSDSADKDIQGRVGAWTAPITGRQKAPTLTFHSLRYRINQQ